MKAFYYGGVFNTLFLEPNEAVRAKWGQMGDCEIGSDAMGWTHIPLGHYVVRDDAGKVHVILL